MNLDQYLELAKQDKRLKIEKISNFENKFLKNLQNQSLLSRNINEHDLFLGDCFFKF